MGTGNSRRERRSRWSVGRCLTALAVTVVALPGLAACSVGAGTGPTTEDLQELRDEVDSLGDRLSALEEPSEATAGVELSVSCIAAIRMAEDVYTAINDLGAAARDLDAVRLDEVIRSLQPIQQEIEEQLADCEVDTTVSTGTAGTPSPSSSPATPTD